MVASMVKKYDFPEWGNVYITYISTNSGNDDVEINIVPAGTHDLRTIGKLEDLAQAEPFLEGYMTAVVNISSRALFPYDSKKVGKQGWIEEYAVPIEE